MIPGEALLYTRANGVVYAQYRDPPHNSIPRWIIGGDPGAVARAQGDLLDYVEWQDLCNIAVSNPTLKKLMDNLVNTYYMVKEEHQ
tara:strand:+ start:1634 stop:1891 length:258 start_codon:yes stop_codon:yes gene_type:complete